jgi:hypothetical protein
MRVLVSVSALMLSLGAAKAHNTWVDGAPVPDWVKQACCGPADAHHLRPEQVHRVSDDFYEVEGYYGRVSAADAQPSPDGEYWIFYKDNMSGSQTGVFCFFVPMSF